MGRDMIRRCVPQQLMAAGGLHFFHKQLLCLWPRVSPPHHLMPSHVNSFRQPGLPAQHLFVPQAVPHFGCFSRQQDENGGDHQVYDAWALYDAGSFINPLAGLWGRLCSFVGGLSAVTGACSNHKSILKCIPPEEASATELGKG